MQQMHGDPGDTSFVTVLNPIAVDVVENDSSDSGRSIVAEVHCLFLTGRRQGDGLNVGRFAGVVREIGLFNGVVAQEHGRKGVGAVTIGGGRADCEAVLAERYAHSADARFSFILYSIDVAVVEDGAVDRPDAAITEVHPYLLTWSREASDNLLGRGVHVAGRRHGRHGVVTGPC